MKVPQRSFNLVKLFGIDENFDEIPHSSGMPWLRSRAPVPYLDAVAAMERHVEAIRTGGAPELVWLLEHPALYTAGTSAKPGDLIEPERLPVFQTGRGGQYTYHGPGQRIAYLMLDLSRRGKDVRRFVRDIERWVIDALRQLGVEGACREGRTGIWVPRPEKGASAEDKIAAIGIRVRRWVSFHGVSINVDPDLAHYAGIVPCGILDQGVTSLADLGRPAPLTALDEALIAQFARHFSDSAETDAARSLNLASSHMENRGL
jgi:lipoyl(octanoyl) transferase